MAENVGSLFYDVTLETADLLRKAKQAAESALGIGKGVDKATAATGRFVDASGRLREANGRFVATGQAAASMGASVESAALKFNSIVSAIQVYAAALAVVKASKAADEVRMLGARVEVAAGSVEKGTAALRELNAISERTRTAVGDNAAVFARLNQSILQLGGTQRDTLELTELLGKAITVSGASAQEKSAAMLQFAQAIGSGKLAGDELRSLLENAPYLMRQLADGLGVPIGALKQLGEEGKLTSDVVLKALGSAADKIEADFKRLPVTLDGALTVTADALRRLNQAQDEASGGTLALTGLVQGAGEAFDLLATQINAASDKQDALGKSTIIQQWKDNTVQALSYVVDAGEVVVRTFRAIGLVIYNAGAAAAQAAGGDFAAARSQLQGMVADLDELQTKRFSGAAMRDQISALATDRLARGGAGTGGRSNLRGGGGGGTKDKFDDRSYLAGLERQATEGAAKIDAIEREALAKNEALLKQGKINRATYEQAITLIQQAAAMDRRDLALKAAEEDRADAEKRDKEFAEQEAKSAKARTDIAVAITFDAEQRIALIRDEAMREAEDGYRRGALTFEEAEAAKVRAAIAAAEQFRALERQRAAVRSETLGLRASTGGVDAQTAVIDDEMQRRLAANEEARQRDLANAQLYADLEVEIIADAERRKAAARFAADQLALQSASATFASLGQMAQDFGGEADRSARVLFAISKAFAIADAIVKIQQGVASAMALPYPANLAAAASVAAQGASIVGIVKGTNYGGGRQYGGPAMAGTLYRVNETGRPEMFTAANGSQYMLPTQSGSVTPASDVGGGATVIELRVINQAPNVSVSQRTGTDGRPEIVVAEVAAQISERRGPVWAAMRTTNIRGQQ